MISPLCHLSSDPGFSNLGDPRGRLRGQLFKSWPQNRIRSEKLLLTCNFGIKRGQFKKSFFSRFLRPEPTPRAESTHMSRNFINVSHAKTTRKQVLCLVFPESTTSKLSFKKKPRSIGADWRVEQFKRWSIIGAKIAKVNLFLTGLCS